jgi:8-oxo-dGTP pyrophosphatase MutT (NUDIX family)
VVRETLEETAFALSPEALVGVYLWHSAGADRTFLRVAFCGSVNGPDPDRGLDRAVLRVLWLSREQLQARAGVLRSPLVLRCIDDYLAGARHPLGLLASLDLEDAVRRPAIG